MAYDLVLRRHLSRDHARGSDPLPPSERSALLSTIVAGSVLLLPHVVRRVEVGRYRREYEGDLSTTREMPALSMSELVYESLRPDQEESS